MSGPNMTSFQWTPKRDKAATTLAQGATQREAADTAGVAERTIRRWLKHPEFQNEVDRLTHMLGYATPAGRLRLAYRVIEGRVANSQYPISKADLLDWLKFIQSETNGTDLDLAAFFATMASVAGRRQESVIE